MSRFASRARRHSEAIYIVRALENDPFLTESENENCLRLVDDLKGWRTGSNGRGSLLKKEELLKELGKKHCQMNDVFKKQDFRGAEEFSSWFAYFHSSEDVSLYRNAEALAGRKVKQFFELLNSFIERESNLEFRNYLLPYHEYLAIRDEDYKPQNEQVQPFKDFHPRILKALCTETDKYVKSSIKSNNKGARYEKSRPMSLAGCLWRVLMPSRNRTRRISPMCSVLRRLSG